MVGAGTNILILARGDKHNTAQLRSDVEKCAWTVGGEQDHQRPLKPPIHFQKGLGERTVCEN